MLSSNPLVSIVTICFNAEATIRDTLASIQRQTYEHMEYIVIDGGSTDGTTGILTEFESVYSRPFRWVSETDRGIFDAMNKGLQMARGEVIGILNADDWYEPETVEEVVKAFARSPDELRIVAGRLCLCDRSGRKLYYRDPSPDVHARVERQMPVHHPSTFVPRAVYDRIGTYDREFELSADYDLVFRAVKAGVSFFSAEKVVTNMRVGGLSSVGLKNDRRRVLEDHLIRRKHGVSGAFRYFLKDLLMVYYRKLKRRIFGKFFVLIRVDLE